MTVSNAFIEDMTTALGGNLIDVELDQKDFQYAFDQAKRLFVQKGNNNLDKKFYSLSITEGTRVYTLPSNENIDTVIRIIKPTSSFSSDDPFSMASIQQVFGSQQMTAGSSLISYELTMQLLDNINIYIAHSTDFIWKKRNNELTLLDTPKIDETWMLELYADLSDAEYEEVLWVREYTLAQLKMILGRAYRKFQTLTTPSGETPLDGEQLVQDGKEEKERLIENIQDYVDGDPTGSVIMIG